jgi:hypothetical protein
LWTDEGIRETSSGRYETKNERVMGEDGGLDDLFEGGFTDLKKLNGGFYEKVISAVDRILTNSTSLNTAMENDDVLSNGVAFFFGVVLIA